MILATLLLSGATVVLPMEASARGTELTLGEIAEVRCDDADLFRRLHELDLGYTPSPGYSRLLHAQRIRQEIERKLPGIEVSIVGQTACRVRPETVRIQPASLRTAVEAELSQTFAGHDVTYTLRDEITPVTVPAGTADPVLRVRLERREPKSGALSVPVQILVDGAPYRTVWTTWETARYETLPVLVRDVAAGEILRPSLVHNLRVLVKPGPRRKPLPGALLAGATAARDLKAGESITDLDVHRPTVVQAGDDLYLEVRKGAVSARVAVEALSSGAIGDRIRLRVISSNMEQSAVLISRDLARIDLGR